MPVDRRSYIGGSDAAAAMGDNPYMTRRDLWERLRGTRESADLSDNPHIQRGNFMETEVALPKLHEELQGRFDLSARRVREGFTKARERFDVGGGHDGQVFMRHADERRVAGHPDALWIHPTGGTLHLFEIKAPTMSNVERIQRYGVKDRYYWQLAHYGLIVSSRAGGAFPETELVVFDYDNWTNLHVSVPIQRDDAEVLFDAEQDMLFAAKMDVAPTPAPFAGRDHFEVTRDPELEDLLARYHDVAATERECKDIKKELKPQILAHTDPDVEESRVITERFEAQITRNRGPYDATYLIVTRREGS